MSKVDWVHLSECILVVLLMPTLEEWFAICRSDVQLLDESYNETVQNLSSYVFNYRYKVFMIKTIIFQRNWKVNADLKNIILVL